METMEMWWESLVSTGHHGDYWDQGWSREYAIELRLELETLTKAGVYLLTLQCPEIERRARSQSVQSRGV